MITIPFFYKDKVIKNIVPKLNKTASAHRNSCLAVVTSETN